MKFSGTFHLSFYSVEKSPVLKKKKFILEKSQVTQSQDFNQPPVKRLKKDTVQLSATHTKEDDKLRWEKKSLFENFSKKLYFRAIKLHLHANHVRKKPSQSRYVLSFSKRCEGFFWELWASVRRL